MLSWVVLEPSHFVLEEYKCDVVLFQGSTMLLIRRADGRKSQNDKGLYLILGVRMQHYQIRVTIRTVIQIPAFSRLRRVFIQVFLTSPIWPRLLSPICCEIVVRFFHQLNSRADVVGSGRIETTKL